MGELVNSPLFNDQSLLFYYRLNDTVLDSGRGGLNGTLVGAPSYKAGFFGNTVGFTGNGTYVTLPAGVKLAELTSSTLSFWFKRNGALGTITEVIYCERKASSAIPIYTVVINVTAGTVGFRYRNDANSIVTATSAASVCDNANNLITCVNNAGSMQVYINGVASGTPQTKPANPISPDTYRIGSDVQDSTVYIDSSTIVDDLAGFSRALSLQEIKNLFTGNWGGGAFLTNFL